MYKFLNTVNVTGMSDVFEIISEYSDAKFLVYNKDDFYSANELGNLDWDNLLENNVTGVPVHIYTKVE